MADGMTGHPHAAQVMVVAVWLLTGAMPLSASDLADPTRPPAGFAAHTAEAPLSVSPPRVSSVLLMGAKSHAIVDGRLVRVGDRLQAGRVDKIDETGVWLRTSAGPRRLELLPGIEKLPSRKSTMEKP